MGSHPQALSAGTVPPNSPATGVVVDEASVLTEEQLNRAPR
ncbi:hypothetical protein [Micromonospora cremea]|nr:hypothetical protein [Micromonospora cremea]